MKASERTPHKPGAMLSVVACCIATLSAGCATQTEQPAAPKSLSVVVGVPPLAFLVEQIAGNHVKVDSLVQPGQDPHTFEPTPQQVIAISHASAFFEIGMPFEHVILEKVRDGNARLRLFDATRAIQKRTWNTACCTAQHDDHEDADAHEAVHGEPDPHVWLSLPLLKTMAENVAADLCDIDPSHREDYQKNLHALLARIDETQQRIQQRLEPYRGRAFYVFHPGFGYFADAYGLKEEAVELGGQSPTAKQFRELITKAKADHVTTIFTQPQYASQSAQAVADAIGGRVVSINGLDKDVLADIEDIAAKVEAAFTAQNASRE